MNYHDITPDVRSKEWLLYCLTSGIGQREVARLANVSTPTVRLWVKKHGIVWRTISQSLLLQSSKVSERARQTWSDLGKRQSLSIKMKEVLSTRKDQLSQSAKLNWKNNREAIVAGIRRIANDPSRIQKLRDRSLSTWQNKEYRNKMSEIMISLWRTEEYRTLATRRTKEHTNIATIKERWKNEEYRLKMINIAKERCSDPNYIEKLRNISKTLWLNPDYRVKQFKATPSRSEKSSRFMREKWLNAEYRSKRSGLNVEKFLLTSVERFGDKFNYDSARFVNWKNKIAVKCNICNDEFEILPQSHIEHGYCQTCGTSKGQREIFEFISQFTECEMNNRNFIKPFELDVYSKQYLLAVEYHGLYWHSTNSVSQSSRARHQNKSLMCSKNNIKLLQFFDFEWEYNQDLIKSMISNYLGISKALNARDLKINVINNIEAKPFLTRNHLQGHRNAQTTLALTENNNIMMIMSFSKQDNGFEIIRMASERNFRIRGGASRLLTAFMRLNPNKKIFTYADMRYSTGNAYKRLGFKQLGHTTPGYFYYRNNIILSRQQCQKNKLEKLLGENFDKSLSESQNMFNNGFRRVWDAGHVKLIFNN